MNILGALGAINALLLALILIKRKKKHSSDKVLIAWVLNFSLYFGFYFLFESHSELSVYWLIPWGILLLSHPVFLFIYASSLSKKGFVFNIKIASNFLVIILWFISMIPFLLLSHEDRLKLVYEKQSIGYEMFLPMMLQLCAELFFFIRTLIVLIQHQNNIKQEFSFQTKINLGWLKLLTYLYIVVLISNVVGYSLVSTKILNIKVMDDLLMVVRLILFSYMVYHAIKQKLIYKPDTNISKQKAEKTTTVNSESFNSQPIPIYDETIEKLRAIMVDEKLYLEQELSLGETANKLGIHSHQLSKLLNVHLNKNFFEFVNEYRIDEFKRLVLNPNNKHKSLLGLAMDAGFNSKATFNRFFKNFTGLTPSQFREHHKP